MIIDSTTIYDEYSNIIAFMKENFFDFLNASPQQIVLTNDIIKDSHLTNKSLSSDNVGGYYSHNDGLIYVNLNTLSSSRAGDVFLFYILAHELTHKAFHQAMLNIDSNTLSYHAIDEFYAYYYSGLAFYKKKHY